ERHRPQAGAAHLIEAPGSLFLRNTGLHRSLTSWVLTLPSGEDLAENDLVHFARLDVCSLEGSLDGDRAEVMRGRTGKCAMNDPTGVLAADAITMSVMASISFYGVAREFDRERLSWCGRNGPAPARSPKPPPCRGSRVPGFARRIGFAARRSNPSTSSRVLRAQSPATALAACPVRPRSRNCACCATPG